MNASFLQSVFYFWQVDSSNLSQVHQHNMHNLIHLDEHGQNKNSDEIPKDKEPENSDELYIEELDLDLLPKPDKLIICYSPPWIPPAYWPLFCLWMDICNKKFNTFYQMHEVQT